LGCYKQPRIQKKFEIEGINQEAQQTLCNKSKDILKHRDGTDYEDLYLIGSHSGKVVGSQTKTEYAAVNEFDKHYGIVYNDDVKRAIKNNYSGPLNALHNHPTGTPPIGSDFKSFLDHNYRYGVINGNDGSVYLYSTSETDNWAICLIWKSVKIKDLDVPRLRHMKKHYRI
jgi:hypothetical protein